jgi:hypothetical protein
LKGAYFQDQDLHNLGQPVGVVIGPNLIPNKLLPKENLRLWIPSNLAQSLPWLYKSSHLCKCQKEEKKRGMGYHCDEKWSVGHKWKSMKLYLIEVPEKEGDCVAVDGEEEEP